MRLRAAAVAALCVLMLGSWFARAEEPVRCIYMPFKDMPSAMMAQPFPLQRAESGVIHLPPGQAAIGYRFTDQSTAVNVKALALVGGKLGPREVLSVSRDGTIRVYGRKPKNDHEVVQALREWAKQTAKQ